MYVPTRLAFPLLGALAALACSDGDSGGSASRGEVPDDELPASMSSAICQNAADCCTRSGFAFDATTCGQNVLESTQYYLGEREGLEVTYNPTAAAACTQALAAALSACDPLDSAALAPCDAIFVGRRSIGESCVDSVECESSRDATTCDMDSGTGICALAAPEIMVAHGRVGDECYATCRTTAEGESCSTSGESPEGRAACYSNEGTVCDFSTSRCVSAPALGESCSGDCGSAAYCSGGVCTAQQLDGPCTTPEACADTAHCSAGQCVPRKSDGAACTTESECRSGACLNGACRPVTVATARLCQGTFN